MHYLHCLFRYTFAAIVGFLCGILPIALCAFCGLLFLTTPFVPIQLFGLCILATGVCLFAIGLKVGFAWGLHFYRTHIQGDAANSLLHKIDRLPPSQPIPLLTKDEINQLQHMPEHKNQLDRYLHDIEDCCPISHEPFSSEAQFVTITGVTRRVQDGVGIVAPFTKTYEKNSIREWIKTCGEEAKEPEIGCNLNDPVNNIEFHPGFAPWIYQFIQKIRSLLTCSSHATIQSQIKEEKESLDHCSDQQTSPTQARNVRTVDGMETEYRDVCSLAARGKFADRNSDRDQKEPPEKNVIKAQEDLSEKAKTALLRQQYYQNRFIINKSVNTENKKLNFQQPIFQILSN